MRHHRGMAPRENHRGMVPRETQVAPTTQRRYNLQRRACIRWAIRHAPASANVPSVNVAFVCTRADGDPSSVMSSGMAPAAAIETHFSSATPCVSSKPRGGRQATRQPVLRNPTGKRTLRDISGTRYPTKQRRILLTASVTHRSRRVSSITLPQPPARAPTENREERRDVGWCQNPRSRHCP